MSTKITKKYYEIQMNSDETHSLDEVYNDTDIFVSPKIRKLLSNYLDMCFTGEQINDEEHNNPYRHFYYYDSPECPWWGYDIGCIKERELGSVVCPYCGSLYLNGRNLPVIIPSNFEYLVDKTTPYSSLEAFRDDVNSLEKYFKEQRIYLDLCPGDKFAPLIWENPLYWNRDKLFGFILIHQMGKGIVIDETSLNYIRNNMELTGMRIDPLLTHSVFCESINVNFHLITSEYMLQNNQAIYQELGYTNVYCEQGKHWHWITDQQVKTECNKKLSSYRKNRQLPQRFIPNSCFFPCPIYQNGMIADEQLVNLLSSIDKKALIGKELTIIEY